MEQQSINKCQIEVSIGELYDKYTILLIKKNKILNIEKLTHILNELQILENIIKLLPPIDKWLLNELLEINTILWNIEDSIRIKEKNKQFDNEFITLARNVYFTNDKRFEIKNKINNLYNSNIFEVKSYENYC